MDDIELIAGFMGFERKQGKQLASYKAGGDSWYYTGDNFTELEAYYLPNINWNHLMPVWYKFRDLKFSEETYMKLHLNYVARLAQDIAYGTIEEVHHKICIAIKWYNSINNNHGQINQKEGS